MKKTSLLFAMLMVVCMSVKAQFSENFDAVADGGIPAGWTRFNVDGLTPATSVNWVTNAWVCYAKTGFQIESKCAWSTSWYNPAGTANDWMFTPAIVVPATNPVLKYTVVAQDPNYPDGYELRIMTVAPTSGNITSSTVLLTVASAETTPTVKTINLSAYATQTVYIGWRNNSYDMFLLAVDDVEVKSLQNNDAAITSINTPAIVAAGNTNITGTVKNVGYNVITSFDVTYKIDGGVASAVYPVTGQSIAMDATYDFTHNVPASLAVGSHTIEVTISNVNGTTDPNPADNVLTKNVSVASQTVPKMCLFEGFSSSTCPPCATWNSTFNPWAAANDANMNYIKYQVDWPSTGDPYYIAQAGDRVNYYGVTGVPDMYANGASMTTLSTSALNAAVAQAAAENTPFNISCTPTYTGNVVSIPVTINPYVTISGLKVQVVVCEKITTGNVGSNGETEWHHVMMQMLPTSAGAAVNFTDGAAYTNTLTKDMSTTFVEEMSDLVVVVFIQDDASKQVLQSKSFSIVILGIGENTMNNPSFWIYPNPFSNNTNVEFSIAKTENASFGVYNLIGEKVLSIDETAYGAGTHTVTINANDLSQGVYYLNAIVGDQKFTQKLTIVK